MEFEHKWLLDYGTFLLHYKERCLYGQVPMLMINDSLIKAQTVAMMHHIARHWTPSKINLYPMEHLYTIKEVFSIMNN
ncbi:hypothetical protein ACA910_014944 [Epithemia clementina (nom. ined.)]